MESSESQPFHSLKSKKAIKPSSKSVFSSSSSLSSKTLAPSPDLSSKTPEKPTQCRIRNRGIALPVKEFRKIAEGLRESDRDRSDPITFSRSNLSSVRKRIASWPEEILVRKSKNVASYGAVKLPEKYEMLVEFFNSLDSSIRLLRLKGSASTFTNICPKIESLTDRRFSYGHLAQLKFILPEAIVIKKVLRLDERTNCMKPDLHVTLEVDAIENDGKLKLGSENLHMRKVFRMRLLDFFKAHPEGVDIPGETLPEPFNRSKQDMHSNTIKASNSSLPIETLTDALFKQQPIVASHLSQTCKTFKTSPCSLESRLPATPSKEIDSSKNEICSPTEIASMQVTPAKLTSTPAKLMTVTPALQSPKRCRMSQDVDFNSSLDRSVRRTLQYSSIDSDIFDVLPDSLLQSVQEKDRKAIEERDPAMSQAKRRREIIASLPKLFNMIHLLFQSIKCSVITKEELIHKIIASHCDVVDRREVEEQLTLLQELVPEWISEKLEFIGDCLICINKTSSPKSILARLAEAK